MALKPRTASASLRRAPPWSPWLRRVQLLAGIVLVASLAWLLLRPGGPSAPPAPVAPLLVTRPVAASPADLRALPRTLGHPVYWAGARAGDTYELTKTAGGDDVYIRYLPRGVEVGDPRADLVSIGSYRVSDPFAEVDRESRMPALFVAHVPHRGLAVALPAHPRSVYVAYPGGRVLIEIYAPSTRIAERIAISGALRVVE